METDQHPDAYIYIVLVLAAIAAFASTMRSPAQPTPFSMAVLSSPAGYNPTFGEAVPLEPTPDEPDLTAPP